MKKSLDNLSSHSIPCHSSKNCFSTEVSPTTSCRNLQSLPTRKLSNDSLELNISRSPNLVNSTLRKKKPAPQPPSLLTNLTKEVSKNL